MSECISKRLFIRTENCIIFGKRWVEIGGWLPLDIYGTKLVDTSLWNFIGA